MMGLAVPLGDGELEEEIGGGRRGMFAKDDAGLLGPIYGE